MTTAHAELAAAPGTRRCRQQLWASGDYQALAAGSIIVGERLCDAVRVRSGQKVLDVATGTGNTALAASRRTAHVTALDFVPALLERGRLRASVEGLPLHLVCADAEELPFPSGCFDVVLSTLGIVFAPEPERAAAELVRVCRPGGSIGLANWTPDGWAAGVGAIIRRYVVPKDKASPPPSCWESEEGLRRLFNGRLGSLKVRRRCFFVHRRSPGDYWDFFVGASGTLSQLFEGLEPDIRQAINTEAVALTCALNRSGDASLVLPHDYLEVVAVTDKR